MTNNEEFLLSMQDIKDLTHNLNYKTDNDFMENYSWAEDTVLQVKNKLETGYWDAPYDKNVEVTLWELYEGKRHIGYALVVEGKVKFLVGIYEPSGATLDLDRARFTCWGHEQIINLWLNDKQFEMQFTM